MYTDCASTIRPAVGGEDAAPHAGLRAACAGDRAARQALCAYYLPLLRRWAQRWLPRDRPGLNDADDLVQIAMLRSLSRLREFEVRSDAGFAAYLRKGNLVVFTHTEVDPEHEGHGVASALARGALDDVRRRDLKALLRCPFLREWITHHPEYDDVVAHREVGSDTP